MIDILLGVIALATLMTAVVQVVVIVGLVRMVSRIGDRVGRFGRLVSPVTEHIAAVGTNIARAAAIADAQIDRVASAYAAIEVPLARIMTAVGVAKSVAAVVRRVGRKKR